MDNNLEEQIDELETTLKKFAKWNNNNLTTWKDIPILHYAHITGNLAGSSAIILENAKKGELNRLEVIPYYIKALKTYIDLIDSNPLFREKELSEHDGCFPDIQDNANPIYNSVKVGGSAYYSLKSKERLSTEKTSSS